MLMLTVRALVFGLGAAVALGTFFSAVQTFVLPRSARTLLPLVVFRVLRLLFDLRLKRARSYEARDRVMALYGPIGLMLLPIVSLILIGGGYTAMFWAMGVRPWREALRLSGSSVLTLGFATSEGFRQTLLVFSEALIGLILIALLISYLPVIYSAFSRREAAVTLLEVRAGTPPSAVEMIARHQRLGRFDDLGDLWVAWEGLFAEIEESHTSLAVLSFFRSPQPEHSWVTATGAVLDAAAMMNAAVATPHDPRADLCIRAGYLALQRIAAFFQLEFNPTPSTGDSISISRQEFDAALAELHAGGVALKPDRDQAWRDFAGWRVNYDAPLLGLAELTMAPYAPWSSDRGLPRRRVWYRRGSSRDA